MNEELSGHNHSKIEAPQFFAGYLTPVIKNQIVLNVLDWANPLDNLFPNQFHKDIINRLKTFESFEKKTHEQVIDELIAQNPNAITILKIMDLECMGAGKVPKNIMEQVLIIHAIKKLKYPQLRLFPMIDPRSPHKARLLSYMKVFHEDFAGFTVYPNVGYSILDEGLDEAFEWATLHKKAVMIHCTVDTPTYFKGSKKELKRTLQPLKKYNFYIDGNRQELCSNFAHPHLTYLAAKRWTEVNFCLCHLGGRENPDWNFWCDEYMYSMPNIYGDWSSRVHNAKELNNLLSSISAKRKVFPGRDWYMNVMWEEENMYELEKQFYINGLRYLREKI